VIARRKKGLLAFRRHDDEQACIPQRWTGLDGARLTGSQRQQPSPVPGRAAIVL